MFYAHCFLDTNECIGDEEVCGANSDCENTIGAFSCVCDAGFKRQDPDGECEDQDECATEQNRCDINADCTNTPGSYECACAEDFEGDGFTCEKSMIV